MNILMLLLEEDCYILYLFFVRRLAILFSCFTCFTKILSFLII